jgi:hypothetical protein
MTLYVHPRYDTVVSRDLDGTMHTHQRPGTEGGDFSLEPDQQPWPLNCTPGCEASAHEAAPYSASDPKGIPLTQDEQAAATAEAARSNVDVANMARAMKQLITAGAPG